LIEEARTGSGGEGGEGKGEDDAELRGGGDALEPPRGDAGGVRAKGERRRALEGGNCASGSEGRGMGRERNGLGALEGWKGEGVEVKEDGNPTGPGAGA